MIVTAANYSKYLVMLGLKEFVKLVVLKSLSH